MKSYRALVELWYPTDRNILRRLRAGERVPMEQRHDKFVAVGEIVSDIPAESIGGFLAKGKIEEVADGDP